MLAFSTCHVVAPTVLLNGGAAFGAFFSIGVDPIGSFRIVFALLDPHFYQGTRRRLMIIEGTSKAEPILARTYDCRYYSAKILFLYAAVDGIFTVRRWTPLKMVLIVNICSGKENLIPINHVNTEKIPSEKQSYLDLRSAATSKSSDLESTIRLQPLVGHCILAASPSSLIFCAKYCL